MVSADQAVSRWKRQVHAFKHLFFATAGTLSQNNIGCLALWVQAKKGAAAARRPPKLCSLR